MILKMHIIILGMLPFSGFKLIQRKRCKSGFTCKDGNVLKSNLIAQSNGITLKKKNYGL